MGIGVIKPNSNDISEVLTTSLIFQVFDFFNLLGITSISKQITSNNGWTKTLPGR